MTNFGNYSQTLEERPSKEVHSKLQDDTDKRVAMRRQMKLDTVIFLVIVCFAVLSNLIYGLLLLETITSGTNIVISLLFTNLFILWLMPLAVGLVLLTMKLTRKTQH